MSMPAGPTEAAGVDPDPVSTWNTYVNFLEKCGKAVVGNQGEVSNVYTILELI